MMLKRRKGPLEKSNVGYTVDGLVRPGDKHHHALRHSLDIYIYYFTLLPIPDGLVRQKLLGNSKK